MTRFLTVLLALVLVGCSGAPTLEPGQVQTTQGVAQGVTAGGMTGFIGIEYARAERWKRPYRAPDWEGVKTFDTPGAVCPQKGSETTSEDCLFLNIFMPEGTKRGDKLPILFQIHGGGFIAGQGGAAPAPMTRHGIIVVTMNYRLGRLGFYDHPSWDENKPRNFGLLDVISALDWTRENAADFGGDVDDITIAGHSAGGMMVQMLMVSPTAKGKFAKAISRAGYGAFPFPEAGITTELEARINYDAPDTKKTAAEFIAETPHFLLPFTKTPELPAQPIAMFREGKQAKVPYITGGNSFDGGGILYGAGYTDESFLALFGDNLPALKTLYADDFAVSEAQAAQRIMGDLRYVLSARESARAMERHVTDAYTYYVDAPVAGQAGTPHGAESSLIWGPRPNPFQGYWVNFIRTGDPNSADLPRWEVQTKTDDNWMVFTPRPEPREGVLSAKLDFLRDHMIAP